MRARAVVVRWESAEIVMPRRFPLSLLCLTPFPFPSCGAGLSLFPHPPTSYPASAGFIGIHIDVRSLRIRIDVRYPPTVPGGPEGPKIDDFGVQGVSGSLFQACPIFCPIPIVEPCITYT